MQDFNTSLFLLKDKFVKNKLLSGSFVVLAGSILANFGNYLFHMLMGRYLGPEKYGTLVSLISLFSYWSIPVGVMGLVIVKYSSENINKKKKLIEIINSTTEKSTKIFGVVLLVSLILSLIINKRLNTSPFLIFVVMFSSFISIYQTIFLSVLQGMLKFFESSLAGTIGVCIKLFLSIILIFAGIEILAPLFGILISIAITSIIGLFFIKKELPDLNFTVNSGSKIPLFDKYSINVFLSNVALLSLYTSDLILAKLFLSPVMAGYYACLSVLGKIVFYASSPIITVMFPLVSERRSKGQNYKKILIQCILMLISISIVVLIIFTAYPTLMISILYGSKYIGASPWLPKFALFISIYAVSSLLVNFFLSINEKKAIYISVIFAIIQILLINIFHKDINEILNVNIFITITLNLLLFTYFLRKKTY